MRVVADHLRATFLDRRRRGPVERVAVRLQDAARDAPWQEASGLPSRSYKLVDVAGRWATPTRAGPQPRHRRPVVRGGERFDAVLTAGLRVSKKRSIARRRARVLLKTRSASTTRPALPDFMEDIAGQRPTITARDETAMEGMSVRAREAPSTRRRRRIRPPPTRGAGRWPRRSVRGLPARPRLRAPRSSPRRGSETDVRAEGRPERFRPGAHPSTRVRRPGVRQRGSRMTRPAHQRR